MPTPLSPEGFGVEGMRPRHSGLHRKKKPRRGRKGPKLRSGHRMKKFTKKVKRY